MPPLFSKRDLAALVLPLIAEQILVVSLGVADIFMVGAMGEGAVSAVSLGDSINLLVTSLFTALATGGAVVCAHYLGAANRAMISRTAKQLIYTAAIISLVISLGGLLFMRPLLNLIFGNIDVQVMNDTSVYFFYSLLSYPFIAVYSAASALFRAQGNSAVSMWTAILINVLNIGGNALCIYGWGWGVEGVAIPTLLSRAFAALLLIALLYRSKPYRGRLEINVSGLMHIKLEPKIIKQILAIGVPNSIENSVFQIGKILVLTLIASFGTAAVAANAAASKICEISCIPGFAMSYAMITVVGQALGAKRPEEAISLNRSLLIVTYISLGAATIPLMIWARPILELFKLQSDTVELGRIMFLFHGSFGLLIWPTAFVLPASLRAAGDARFTMFVSFASMWIVRVGLSYIFAFWTSSGALAVWYAMILDWFVRSIFFILRWKRGCKNFKCAEQLSAAG